MLIVEKGNLKKESNDFESDNFNVIPVREIDFIERNRFHFEGKKKKKRSQLQVEILIWPNWEPFMITMITLSIMFF